MLILTRKVGENIIIGDNIRITVAEIAGNKVRIGIAAPPDVTVDRQEVHERRKAAVLPAVHLAATGPPPAPDAHIRN